jgi:hypothetical protein
MISWRRLLILFSGASLLGACGDAKLDSSALTARSNVPAEGPNCAGCHGYPLQDTNHSYHLEKAVGNKFLNGKITCLDCHSHSIRSRDIILFDSAFEEASGEKYFTQAYPNPRDTTTEGHLVRSLPLLFVDTLPQPQPLTLPARHGPQPAFQEYMTGLAHMNRTIDVVFDNRMSLPARFNGDSASYNPTQESCSAIACHPGSKPYSWGSKAKGLPVLKDDDEEPAP